MNLVLLVNSHNIAEIRAFVDAAAASQKEKCPGALAVVYQQRLGAEVIQELVAPLLEKFSAGASIPVTVNGDLSNDSRNAVLFSLFVAQAYARFPGPWLVIDSLAFPKGDDFIQALTKQHKGLGGDASGRVSQQGESMIAVGPIVLGIPVKKLSWFSPGVTESWRVKARYLLARCGFKIVPLDEYLFTIPGGVSVAPEAQLALPLDSVVVPTYIAPVKPPVFNPAVLDQEKVASTQPEILSQYAAKSREELFELIEARGLDKPHHSTGAAKLVLLLEEVDDEAKTKEILTNPA